VTVTMSDGIVLEPIARLGGDGPCHRTFVNWCQSLAQNLAQNLAQKLAQNLAQNLAENLAENLAHISQGPRVG